MELDVGLVYTLAPVVTVDLHAGVHSLAVGTKIAHVALTAVLIRTHVLTDAIQSTWIAFTRPEIEVFYFPPIVSKGKKNI